MRTPSLLWLALVLTTAPAEPGPPPRAAFPGAEGFGCTTPGGRGGRVIPVTNLDSDGPGSFRQALLEKGPRIIVFRVGGVILLQRDLNIDEPFVTIAGQSAPGDGICVRGAGLRIRTHDVIVRHLRVRVGDARKGPNPDNRDGIGIGNEHAEVHDIVLDHCSVSWAIDENVQLWYPCHDITIQWCLISESLEHSRHPKGRHGMGLLVGDHAKRISVHHNLFAHNMDRNPLLKGDTEAEVINNLVFNWRIFATGLTDPEGSGPHRADILANLYLPGPQTGNQFGIGIEKNVKPGSAIYLHGNIDPGRPRDEGDEWAAAASRGPVTFRSGTRLLPGDRIKADSAAALPDRVLPHAGATRPKRDAVDLRVVESVRQRTGDLINTPDQAGGWPEYRSGDAPADGDADGIADEWELRHGLNPNDPSDAVRPSPTGSTWIEDYLNQLAADS